LRSREGQIIIIFATSMYVIGSCLYAHCRIVLLAVFEALETYSASALRVNVAKRPIHSAHSISLRDVRKRPLEHGPQGHGIIEGAVASGRIVEEGESICKSVLPVLDILVLPDPPDAIDLGVMNCIPVRDDP
jgi:hypothetical protein